MKSSPFVILSVIGNRFLPSTDPFLLPSDLEPAEIQRNRKPVAD